MPEKWAPRLIWEYFDDEQNIRVNVQLLFEALRNNGLPTLADGSRLDLEEGNLVESFDTTDCFVCGLPEVDQAHDAMNQCEYSAILF